MASIPPEGDESLDAMTGDELRAHALQHGFVLDDWSVNISPFEKNEMNHEYPWDNVEASRRNRRLQKKQRLADGLAAHFAEARPCSRCGAAPDALSWFYFRSPKETWAMECGVAGWMAVCDRCHIQVNFFVEVVS